MDLLKYLMVAVGSIILGIVVALIAHNVLSGILLVVLLFGGYVLLNVTKGLNNKPPENTPQQ
ncbi:MAG: hypothetical protein UR34_C0006G0021 [candidate division WS6 bacterium GW2011_GWC1_33_20]|uniref:Uncharacterized protein n=2 Tax=Candidatus Dojkabacteria TaxID=74243 RepID=A0A0G0CTV8_9BACT|nr:MAG: hypothetical protein UR32_C0011G0004 [candidate division WS6 bacterium GW2011_GWE2_33_157]KKP44100.1 MAG: hypothetical protein UR34_C0006G0021 [candidate division WS6 bacterium GW2011_GWC1_33_20]KKP45027.1 MAG: hypothetical protein UR36_C0011G0004 [candidate division WS6 bacterium GW2011_GWF1_33_233]KKP54498.1 MAG: hypothetical protein UR45_C0013G0004 [candidate division WS6 bacterium GW2011_WS6_33_547]KKP54565.1 MAG: hypothetical protein UR47_C0014G0007 [candidate division WS6 bacteriu